MKRALVSFVCGLVFAIGLAISGMTLPEKVIGFLDVLGRWDSSLALVMGGALAVLFVARALTPAKPVLAPSFVRPPADDINPALLAGAALFGVGWGLSGFCPGPALVSLGTGTRGALAFVPAMLVGMGAHRFFERRLRARSAAPVPQTPNACG